jgi:transposase InsO family protein
MSWKESCAMTERVKFMLELERGEYTMSEACRVYGVSRKTGYKWLERYVMGGLEGLEDRSRAPLLHSNTVDEITVAMLIQARRSHPRWGPRKLLDWLMPKYPGKDWPAPSTVGEVLKRAGLVPPRKLGRRTTPYGAPFVSMNAPNAVWSVDFKGQFRTADMRLCYPLTLSDGFSRFLLSCRGLSSPNADAVRAWMERAFRSYGLPLAIRSDNGTPFASTGLAGLSQLSVWWLKLGILPERIACGHPEQNGRHERMHRTLKQDTCPGRANMKAQQRAFDQFRKEYNQERPHEALGGRTPAQLYQPSLRTYPNHPPKIEYPIGFEVRRVKPGGDFKWNGHSVYLTQALAGEPIGMYQIDENTWRVYFGLLVLGILDTRFARIEKVAYHIKPETLH